jgi:hypothetical protein
MYVFRTMFIMWAFSTTQLGSIKPCLIFWFLYIRFFSMSWLLFAIVILRKWEISIKEDFTTKNRTELMLFLEVVIFLTAYQNRFVKKAIWASAVEIFVRYYGTSSILYGPFFLYNTIFMLLFCDLIIHWVVKFYFAHFCFRFHSNISLSGLIRPSQIKNSKALAVSTYKSIHSKSINV